MYYVLYTIYYILYTMYYILYAICYMLYTIYYILYTVYYILYIVYYIIYAIYYILRLLEKNLEPHIRGSNNPLSSIRLSCPNLSRHRSTLYLTGYLSQCRD